MLQGGNPVLLGKSVVSHEATPDKPSAIFGELAYSLAEAGFASLRYGKRGGRGKRRGRLPSFPVRPRADPPPARGGQCFRRGTVRGNPPHLVASGDTWGFWLRAFGRAGAPEERLSAELDKSGSFSLSSGEVPRLG